MSWIYGAGGGTNFWEEQIKNEKRLKKSWADKYGVDMSSKSLEELQELKAAEAAKAEANAKLTARPKLQKVAPTWKTKCGPTGEFSPHCPDTQAFTHFPLHSRHPALVFFHQVSCPGM